MHACGGYCCAEVKVCVYIHIEMANTDVTLDFAYLVNVRTSRYDVVYAATGDTVEVTFTVTSDKSRRYKEHSTSIPFVPTETTRWHEKVAWAAVMADVGDEIVAFAGSEARKPSSQASFDPLA